MAPESSFTGFGDTYIGTVAPEWDMVSILSVSLSILVLKVQGLYLPHLSAFEGDPLSRGILRPPLPHQLPSYPTSGFDTFFPEIPLHTSSALGVTQDILPFNQVPHEASAFQPQTTATSPYTTTSYHEVAAAEVWHTGPTHSSSSVLPIFPLVCFTRCFFFFPKVSSFRKPTQPVPSSPPVTAFLPNWIKVPQRNYRSKQWNFKRLNPISFSVDGRPGVNMGEALRKACADLDGWDDPVLMDAAGAISCRLLVGLL